MKIAFVSFINWDFNVNTPYNKPLGGTHSAMCYLAEAMALQGHEVFMFNNTTNPGFFRAVHCFSLQTIPIEVLQSLDGLIIVNFAGRGRDVKPLLGSHTKLILWTQHLTDQSAMKMLENPEEKNIYDSIVFVSEWQRKQFLTHFDIDERKTHVLRNGISPFFQQLFAADANILAAKSSEPILAYTSTPFRGLNILLNIFPQIRAEIPEVKLKVFSSMKVYQSTDSEDQEEYGNLYQQCRETEGVEYIGSIPQAELAQELKSVSILSYPNTFAETSCIAVMEALASGCFVISSELGALPETSANFGELIPINNDGETYQNQFIQTTIKLLKQFNNLEDYLRKQVDFVNHNYIWSVRANEWVIWLNDL